MSANRAVWRHGPSSRRRRAAAADTNMYDDEESLAGTYRCVVETFNVHCEDCRRYLGKGVSRNPCDGCKYNQSNWACDTWFLSERQDSFVSAWRCYYCVSDALQILMTSEG
ncbi:unnamed protein product [Clonostachys rhizophaga]|uniref:Uncharacterized protein n=1 Tax=Clonostachys rhizophaga TaxID=160324 RepID=A0A9N9V937_9HYPO|nr:unnamed protein product [Clonostachys rhizophaga]